MADFALLPLLIFQWWFPITSHPPSDLFLFSHNRRAYWLGCDQATALPQEEGEKRLRCDLSTRCLHLGPPRCYWEIVGFQFLVLNEALLVVSLRFSEDPKKHKSHFLFLFLCLVLGFFPHGFFFSFPSSFLSSHPRTMAMQEVFVGRQRIPCSPESPCISHGLFPQITACR